MAPKLGVHVGDKILAPLAVAAGEPLPPVLSLQTCQLAVFDAWRQLLRDPLQAAMGNGHKAALAVS